MGCMYCMMCWGWVSGPHIAMFLSHMHMPLYGMYVLHDMLGKVWGLPYCNGPPSLIVKH